MTSEWINFVANYVGELEATQTVKSGEVPWIIMTMGNL